MQSDHIRPPTLGDRGVLAPRRFAWAAILGWMIVLFAALIAIQAFPAIASIKLAWPAPARAVVAVVVAALALLGYALLVRWGERRRADEIAWLPGGWREVAAGLAIGLALFTIVAGIMAAFGLYRLHFHSSGAAWGVIGGLVGAPVIEELVFRAIVFRLMWRAFGPWIALAASAALFGGLHLLNPHATLIAAVAIAIEAGVMLASFYALTGRIWASIGVHAGWNVTQSWLFGAPVSGGAVVHGFGTMTLVPGAPELLTGGAFGPEASLVALAIDGLCGLIVLWLAWRAGNLTGSSRTVPERR